MTGTINNILNAVVWFPWLLVGVGGSIYAYWMFEPVPVELRYVANHFIDAPAETREQAEASAVHSITGGSEVYRYVEYCVRRPFSGTAKRSWVGTAMVWHAPDVPTALSRQIGCRSVNVAVEVPTSNPTRTFRYVQEMVIETNPVRTDRIQYPPIPLTILASKR